MNRDLTKSNMRVGDKTFGLLFTALYALLLAYLMPFHELWPDETEPWLLALYSDSYSELLYNKRFEGHPNLWYSILYVVTRFTSNLQALKISQYVFAVGFAFTFLRYAPFPRIIKVLFCFGYYGLFEYGILSRLYALELFTMFMICTFYHKRFTHWHVYILLLAINAQTHLFGLYFSGVMGLLLFTEAAKLWGSAPQWQKLDNRKIAFGFLLWALGCGFSFWSIVHYLGLGHPLMWDPYKIQQASTRIWQAFFPVPDFTFHFWNTSYLKTRLEIPLSGLLVLVFVYVYKTRRLVLGLFLLFAALFYFFAFKYELYLRHHAHFFLFTVALFWVNTHYITYSQRLSFTLSASLTRRADVFNWVLLLATTSQFLTGVFALYMDYRYPFGPHEDSAAYIQQNFPNHFIATADEFNGSTTGAYLGKPLYNLSRGVERTFFEFDEESNNTLTPFQHVQWATSLAHQKQVPVLLLSSKKIAIELSPYPVRLLKSFEREYILLYEKHAYLYLIEPNLLIKPAFTAGTPAVLKEEIP